MARASFTLRRSTLDKGAYLQYPVGESASASYPPRTDNDNYLRADDLLQVPTDSGFEVGVGQFEATVIDYQAVRVSWNVDLEQTVGSVPVPYEAHILYSSQGPSTSINNGAVLRETTYSDSLVHEVPENTRWAYYTLFIRYLSNSGDDYYEPVASVKVMLPSNYGSTDALFQHIPEYYRWLDDNQSTSLSNGPLYRFLSVIGWDIDRTRTLLDYVIASKDPRIAEQEALDTLARDFGLPIQSHELGVDRVRNLIDSIGTLRRGKGTPEIIEMTFKAITGCDVEYDMTTDPDEIRIFTQRANLIYDPRLISGIVGSIDGGNPSSTYGAGFTLDAGVVGTSQTDGTYDGGSTPNPDYTGGGTLALTGGWKTYADFDDPGTNILERSTPEIMLKTGDVLYFSAHCRREVQDLISAVYLYTGSYADGPAEFVVESDLQTISGSHRYWRLEVPEGYSSYTAMNIAIRYEDSLIYNVNDFDFFLLERNIVGDYFDGDSNRGAWIVDGGGSISDYGWLGSPAESISVYTDNFQKMKKVVAQMVSSILPVTRLVTSGTVYSNRIPTTNLKYTITYNNVPGV